jgi:hypothetical protein
VRSSIKNVHALAKHLADGFQPHPSENESKEEEPLTQLLEPSYQLDHDSNISKELKFKTSSAI